MPEMRERAKDAIEEGLIKAKKAADTVASKTGETLSNVCNWAEPGLDQAQVPVLCILSRRLRIRSTPCDRGGRCRNPRSMWPISQSSRG
jgi:hypothetical protein